MASRDMSERQFLAALKKRGMRPALMGYVRVTESTAVYRYNAGERRRDQLAYLIEQQEKARRRHGRRGAAC